MSGSRTRVLLVEASPLALKTLQTMLASSDEIDLVGAVSQGSTGLIKAVQLRPDVLCISTQVAGLVPLELVKQVMSQCCCPILILHSAGEVVTDFLGAGAVDSWCKPAAIWAANEAENAKLLAKIKRSAQVPVITRSRPREGNEKLTRAVSSPPRPRPIPPISPVPPLPTRSNRQTPAFPTVLSAPIASSFTGSPRVVAVGASTGGPQALVTLFSALPRDFPCPLLCVQHISRGFLKEMVDWLDTSCPLKVKIATLGEHPQPGVVYFSPEDRHLELDARGRLWFSAAPAVDGHRPSVTTLFQSVARTSGRNAVAVLLTGMGSDGAKGMQAIAEAGGSTFAQDEASSVVFGMPKEAIALGAAQHVMKPEEIGRRLIALVAPPR